MHTHTQVLCDAAVCIGGQVSSSFGQSLLQLQLYLLFMLCCFWELHFWHRLGGGGGGGGEKGGVGGGFIKKV